MKVLITDDEIQIRKGLRLKVDWEEEGFQLVEEASNGKEALEILRTNDIDVVITDMRMPIMDGVELAKRCHQEFPHVKVIVLSGYSDFEYVRNSLQQGVKDYLLKPVAPDELVEALRKIRKEVEEEKRKQVEYRANEPTRSFPFTRSAGTIYPSFSKRRTVTASNRDREASAASVRRTGK